MDEFDEIMKERNQTKIRHFIIILVAFFMFNIIIKIAHKQITKENPYYYTKGIIEEKYIGNGIFGSDNHYIKVLLQDGTNIAEQITIENYLLADVNNEMFIVLVNDKVSVKEIIFSEQDLNKYIKSQNELNRVVNLLE